MHEVELHHRYEEGTHTQPALRCLSLELSADFGVIALLVSKTGYLWKRTYYATNRSLETALERLLKASLTLGSSSLSSSKVIVSSFLLSISPSSQSTFSFISIRTHEGQTSSDQCNDA